MGACPLPDREPALWLWRHLRTGFPHALATILMPDHLHMIAPIWNGARRRLCAILANFAARFGLGQLWLPVPEPQALTTGDKLHRGVRYTLLNCCRPSSRRGRTVQLVPDPLVWRWTTLRDVVGAVADPWIDPARLARALRWRQDDFVGSFHRYVTSDPHVSPSGTALPAPASPSDIPEGSIVRIAAAALAATHAPRDALRRRTTARRLFLALAYRQGWRYPTVLARRCDLHPDAVLPAVRRCPPSHLSAGALCLGDARLLAGSPLPNTGSTDVHPPRTHSRTRKTG